jgi:FAD:protein FMN transferase
MGTTAHVLVVGAGAGAAVDRAADRLGDLEQKWSRFLPSSEVSRMNAMPGEHVVVSPETVELVQHAMDAWSRTAGLFDPTVLPALRSAGYDRDFRAVARSARVMAGAIATLEDHPAPGCAAIECDDDLGTITLPRGVEFDAGGIGKGFAADLVSAELVDGGAAGALVNVGGDLRVRGEPPQGTTWDVVIADPARPGREVLRVALAGGGLATSSRVRRSWKTAAGDAHHLIDPRTGRPAVTPHATVAAITAEGWWAEVVAKTALVGALDAAAGPGFDAQLVVVDDDGTVTVDPSLAGVTR